MSEYLVPGSRLAAASGGVTVSTVYSAAYYTEIHRMIIANVDASAHAFTVYHTELTDGAGTAMYTTTRALFYQSRISANATLQIDSQHIGGGISMAPGERIGFFCDNTAACNLFLYGTTRAAR